MRVPPVYRPTPLDGLPLFQTEAHARKSDPATSHAAASKARRSTLQARVLESLAQHGPATSHELAERLGLSLVAVSPRMAPLRRQGKVEEAGSRDGRTVWRACAA